MFISIDGPDGAGKTTLGKATVARLQQEGYKAVFTTEPTDTPLGEQIREALKCGSNNLLDLFLQDRAMHIKEFIEPHLADNFIVVTDRYKYSTVCYQHVQGVPLENLIALNKDFKVPDISFILYADDVTKLLDRITIRGQNKDFFETKEILEKCCKIYKGMPQHFPKENFQMLNAETTESELFEATYDRIAENIRKKG